MRIRPHWLLGLALAAGLPAIEAAAQGAKYPDRPVKMLVGFSAGGGTDVVARILAQKMSEGLGQTVVVENRSGASGLIAGEAVAKSAPDGYTLMMGTQTTFAVAPTLYRKVSLDPARDFAGIVDGGGLAAGSGGEPFGARALGQGRDRDGQGQARCGHFRIGRARHHAAHDGRAVPCGAGIKLTHVAYRGEAPAINDLLGGQIPPDVLEPVRGDRQRPGRSAAGARGHRRAAGGGGARHPDRRGGGPARLRGGDLVRAGGAGRHPARHPGCGSMPRRSASLAHGDVQAALRRSRHDGRGQHARGRSTPTSSPRSPSGPR